MCGIAGIMGFAGAAVREEELRSMCAALNHRGPDGEGIYLAQEAGLGMRRLSIIDLETGDQPVCNEDGSVWVVFNGEIYNFAELRRGLETRGHRFTTRTDTEVIVHLYEERGRRCVDALRGMFAFAVWDEKRRELLLARDRLGIKPLYYTEAGGRLVFASELKAILQVAGVERRIDWASFGHYLTSLTTPATASILAGVRKLPPGHLLSASPARDLEIERYWEVVFAPEHGRSQEWFAERLGGLLEEAVRLHLVSDVPLGAFLSGGIDSSAVVATMARLVPRPVKTFSIGFADQEFSELPYAARVARALGTEHRELVLEPDVLSIIDDLAWHLDEPFGDSSAIPTYMVSKLAAEEVTVVLSGDGGDELFAGYDKYVVEGHERRTARFVPGPLRRAMALVASELPEGVRGRNTLRHFSLPGPERYLDAQTLFRREALLRLVRPEIAELVAASDPWQSELDRLRHSHGHWLSELQGLDIGGYLPLDILTKVDRMTMAHSLEARPPLLDHVLVEFAATIPPELQLQDGVTKAVFKRSMRGLLPDDVIDRRKHVFAIPLGRWFRGRLESFARDLLLSASSRSREIFDPAGLERMLRRSLAVDSLGLGVWTLISFELWCRTFLGSAAPRGRASMTRLHPVPEVAAAQ
jgi:asparagine synthase (glutamine-hydrolysing)